MTRHEPSGSGDLVVRQQEWRYWALLATWHVAGVGALLMFAAIWGGSVVPWLVSLMILLGFQYAVALRHRARRWSDPPVCIVRSGAVGWGTTEAMTWVARPPLGAAEVTGRVVARVRLLGDDGEALHPQKYAFYGFFPPPELKEALRGAGIRVR